MSKIHQTKGSAARWLRQQTEAKDRGELSAAGRVTLAAWVDDWLSRRRGRVEETTWQTYEYHVRQYLRPHLPAGLLLAKTSPMDVEALLARWAECDVAPSGRWGAWNVLRSALKDAAAKGLIPRSPAAAVKGPRPVRGRVEILRPEDAVRFIEVARTHPLAALWELALDTGMRQGELFGLHWPEVDFDAGTVRVVRSLAWLRPDRDGGRGVRPVLKDAKTPRSRRTVAVAPRTLDSLRQHRERSAAAGRDVSRGPVFLGKRGTWLRQTCVHTTFRGLLSEAGCPPVRFHALRHTNATLLLSRGVNVKVVSERLGHEDVMTTLRTYAHVLQADRGAAVRVIAEVFG